MKSYHEFIDNISYSFGRFDRLIKEEDECIIDGVKISHSDLMKIKNFYENTNKFNRNKIEEMINNNIRNVNKVLAIILEYYRNKN